MDVAACIFTQYATATPFNVSPLLLKAGDI